MNGYERIFSVLDGKRPDRVPMMLHSALMVAGRMGYTQEQFRNSAEIIAETNIRFAEDYGMDGMLIDMDTCVEADAMGAKVDYPKDGPARMGGNLSEDIDILRKEITTDKILSSRRTEIMLESIRMMKERIGGQILIRGNCDQMGFSLASLLMGMTPFFEALMDEDLEDDILDIIDRCTDVHILYHKMMKEAGADITSFGDSPCGPDLISLSMYRKFAKPFHKKLKDALDAENIRTLCHICGRLDLILEDLAELNFDAVEIDYKTDMEKAAAVMKGHSVVFGPIDPSGVFFFGTPEKIVEETQKQLDIFRGRGLVIGAGCALPMGTPDANIRAFADTVRAYKIPE